MGVRGIERPAAAPRRFRWKTIPVALLLAYALLAGAVWMFQERLLFHPMPRSPGLDQRLSAQPDTYPITIERPSATLCGWLARGAGEGRRPCLLYFGGNAERVSARALRPDKIWSWGYGFATVAYRGFEGSTGETAASDLAADGLAAFDWLATRPDIDPSRIVLWGLSLGTGIAQHVAARRSAAGIVLLAPYARLSDVSSTHFPWLPARLLLRHEIAPIDDVVRQKAPALILHGLLDATIPIAIGDPIADAWPARKIHLRLPGRTHADLEDWDGYAEALHSFLASLEQ